MRVMRNLHRGQLPNQPRSSLPWRHLRPPSLVRQLPSLLRPQLPPRLRLKPKRLRTI